MANYSDLLQPLLAAGEPNPVEVVNGESDALFLFLCDHASFRMPRALGTLGLSPSETATHIGWDIGAAELARKLAASFTAPLILTSYSRLAIDCNRPLSGEGSIPLLSAGIEIRRLMLARYGFGTSILPIIAIDGLPAY